MGGWMGGWMDGWMDGRESRVKDCLQQSKMNCSLLVTVRNLVIGLKDRQNNNSNNCALPILFY
jgi:hypothetical protein